MSRGRVEDEVPNFRFLKVTPARLGVALEQIKEREDYPKRDRCTVCDTPKKWYELQPGVGRCNGCLP